MNTYKDNGQPTENSQDSSLGSRTTTQDRLMAKQFNVYKTKELWLPASGGYEIRTRLNRDKAPESIRRITKKEAEGFILVAEREGSHWAEVHKEHEDVAQIIDISTGCEWVYNLEKLADGTYRIVDYPISPEEVYDYGIRTADEATVVEFLAVADEQRVIREELKFNSTCLKCPACGEPGQWDFRFGLRFITHPDESTEAQRWCINPNHASAIVCPTCNQLALWYKRESGKVEYLHSWVGDSLSDRVWH
jgi:hypothetical protein